MEIIGNWLRQRRKIGSLKREAAQREARIKELAERLIEQDRVRIETDCKHVEIREHLEATVSLLGAKLRQREDLLSQIVIAVGRVQVLEGQPVSSFEGLPRVVSMVVDDHEDLESRIDAVVEYLREIDPAEIPAAAIRETVGRMLQGAEPEIVDLQGDN